MPLRTVAGSPLNIQRDAMHYSETRFNVERWGAVGDGIVDDKDAFQSCVTAAIAAGKPVFVPAPRAFYRIESTITGDGACPIYGEDRDDTIIQMVTSGDVLFDWSAGGLEVHDLTLKGDGFTHGAASTVDQDERAIEISGADANNYVSDLKVRNCRIQNWGGFAIHASFVENFEVTNCIIHDMGYSGGHFFSCQDGIVQGNNVYSVESTHANQYGFSFTREAQASIANYPRSKRIACVGNIIRDIPKWTGLDTHSGEQITFEANSIRGCSIGIGIGHTSSVSGATEPYAIAVVGNSIISDVTDGSARQGIIFHGADNGAGTPDGLASGSIIGNYIQEHGNSNGTAEGGIYAYCTVGLAIHGNSIWGCSNSGINLDFDNYGITITGNCIVDPWSDNTNDAFGVHIQNGYNTGSITGNSMIAESRSETSVLYYGVYKTSSHTNMDLAVGGNHISGAGGSPYSLGSNDSAEVRHGSILHTNQGRRLNFTSVGNGTTQIDRTHEWISVSVSGGTATLTLPSSHSAGDIYYIHHLGGSLATNSLTIGRNGSNINGAAADHVKNTAGEDNDLTIVSSNGTDWRTHTIPQ